MKGSRCRMYKRLQMKKNKKANVKEWGKLERTWMGHKELKGYKSGERGGQRMMTEVQRFSHAGGTEGRYVRMTGLVQRCEEGNMREGDGGADEEG